MTQKNIPPKAPAIFLMGPTAAGKTDLAMELIQHIPGEIISVDSAMIYRGMDLGTGKPTAKELSQAPHHLIDIRDPSESYSAAEFCNDALQCMQEITLRGKIPILVGGTSLYFRSLEFGLSPLPPASQEVREKLFKQAEEIGWEKMHACLQDKDPIAASRIHPNDPQRISRALEVYEITGQPMSCLWQSDLNETHLSQAIEKYTIHKFALVPRDRTILHQRIADRFHKMLTQGLIEEVQRLYQRSDLHLKLPSMRAVGYRQVWEYLNTLNPKTHLITNSLSPENINAVMGNSSQNIPETQSYQTMVESAIAATRQLAKRQLTWLRNSRNNTNSRSLMPSKITYLEIENSYSDSLQTMIHCAFVNRA